MNKKIKIIMKKPNEEPCEKTIKNDIRKFQKILNSNIEILCWLTNDIVIITSADIHYDQGNSIVINKYGKEIQVNGKFIITKMNELFEFSSLSTEDINICMKQLKNNSTKHKDKLSFA